jgi:2-polyprenyl-3-methyl-5-hydroxy-6-metoxy-1,4-benzoquinol methylase
MNFPNGSILDVGCGMGTLSDYINNEQRPNQVTTQTGARSAEFF